MTNEWKLGESACAAFERADAVARNVIAPAAAEVDERALYPRAALRAMKEAGLLGLVSDAAVGGAGQGLRAAVAVVERYARECPSTAMVTMMHFCGAAVIEAYGNEALRQGVARDGKITTLAFSESGSRSHFWLPRGTAERVPGGIRLNASKQMITSAGECDLYVWSSRPVQAEGLSSIWAVPVDAPGLRVPAPYTGMGLRGNGSTPITAQDVLIPEANRLGDDGKGFDVMMGVVMPFFSLQNCAVSVGCMEGAVARALRHVTTVGYDYDGSKIADLPQVRQHVAKARCRIDAVRGFLADAVDAVESGRGDATLRVLQAKVIGAEASTDVLDRVMRICGGAAYRKDVGVDRFFRDSRAATVMAPVSDALYEFIGKAVCGMPVF